MKRRFSVLLQLIILISLPILMLSCAIRPTPDQIASADYGSYPSDYEEIIKNYYGKSLFDPYSAVFTFSQPQKAWNGWGGTKFGWAVCGSLNAKNRFGGYVGATPFYVLIKNDVIEREFRESLAEGFCQNIR